MLIEPAADQTESGCAITIERQYAQSEKQQRQNPQGNNQCEIG